MEELKQDLEARIAYTESKIKDEQKELREIIENLIRLEGELLGYETILKQINGGVNNEKI